jgi:hypothetical protein
MVGLAECTLSLYLFSEITGWLLRQKLIDVSQTDVNIIYRHLEGEVARRKRQRKHRYLLSLGKFAQLMHFTLVLTQKKDGGGAGGLSEIFILYEIANRIKFDLGLDELPRLCDYFDMIGGVGMGG